MVLLIHTIIYIGYNITKQQQIDLLVSKYMKTLFKIHEPPMRFQNRFQEQKFDFFDMFPSKEPQEKSEGELNKLLLPFDLEISKITYEVLKEQGELLSA